jgi:hypothetical protein
MVESRAMAIMIMEVIRTADDDELSRLTLIIITYSYLLCEMLTL